MRILKKIIVCIENWISNEFWKCTNEKVPSHCKQFCLDLNQSACNSEGELIEACQLHLWRHTFSFILFIHSFSLSVNHSLIFSHASVLAYLSHAPASRVCASLGCHFMDWTFSLKYFKCWATVPCSMSHRMTVWSTDPLAKTCLERGSQVRYEWQCEIC